MTRLFTPLVLLLFSASLTSAIASTPVRLNSDLGPQGDVSTTSLAFSPDGEFVLYLAKAINQNSVEAYIVPTRGGESLKLNAPIISGGNVSSALFSNDGARVLYRAEQDELGRMELYSAAAGQPAIKLNTPLPENASVGTVQFVLDDRVAYIADQDQRTVFEAYIAPLDRAGESFKLNAPLNLGGDVVFIDAETADETLVYVADQELDGQFELYAASLDGNDHWKLNPPLPSQGNVDAASVRVTYDGAHVVYVADAIADNVFSLFSVPIEGGEPVPLTPVLVNGGDVSPKSVQVSPLGDRVLYLADQLVDESFELFSVPVAGGPATRLNDSLVNGGDVLETSLQFSDDGSKVLYIADQQTNNKNELFVVPSDGGVSQRLNAPLPSSGDVESAEFSANGEWVVYLADQNIDTVNELYSVPSSGGDAIRLNSPLVSNGDVLSFAISPDGQHVVFHADQDTNEVLELYTVPIAGGDVRKLSGPLVNNGDVTDYIISPNSDYVVYRADQNVNEQFELFSVPLFESLQALPGDFNFDGMVDAADYTAWRDGLGSEYVSDGYATWKENFGRSSATETSGPEAVPEPTTTLLLAGLLLIAAAGSNRASPARPTAPARTLR